MNTGSIVETVGNFESIRATWGLPYPKRGDVLTVRAITPHPAPDLRRIGIVLLHFEEIPLLPGMCDRASDGSDNFRELMLPPDLEEILSSPIPICKELLTQ